MICELIQLDTPASHLSNLCPRKSSHILSCPVVAVKVLDAGHSDANISNALPTIHLLLKRVKRAHAA